MTLLIGLLSRRFLLIVLTAFFFIITLPLPTKRKTLQVGAGLLLAFAVVNVFTGSQLAHRLVYRYGEPATGMVIGHQTTNNLYNEEPVLRYGVVLKPEKGEPVETWFESWDFNLYPAPANGRYEYPQDGGGFAARFMPKNPKRFVILTNQPSAYSQALDCGALKTAMEEAERKAQFAPESEAYRAEYERAEGRYDEAKCGQLPAAISGEVRKE